jgi:excinuclease ABC subunit C
MATPHIEHKLSLLPDLPGCYLMKNSLGSVIYVGKAKNLKNRVRSYFKSHHEGKTAKLVSKIRDFDTIITSNDKEAFLLEITLIHKHRPHFNIQFRQGNSGYPYINITNERDPQIKIVSSTKENGGYYFGPYPNVYAATETLHFLQKVYPLRRCNGYQHRPCLYYHMGQCLGACFKKVPKEAYANQIRHIKAFLNGDVSIAKKILTKRMLAASDSMQYERAAEIRDQLKYIEVTVEKQKIISNDFTPRDIFNYYVSNGWISIQIFFIRQARLLKRVKRIFPIVDTPEEIMDDFIGQFYLQDNQHRPKEILVPEKLNVDLISETVGVSTRIPQRGAKKDLLDMAYENAKLLLEEKLRLMELDNIKTVGATDELSVALSIPHAKVIESFDHSHIQGVDLVSAMVQFVDGKPNKKAYRKYKLRNVNHADEAASTREVIRRRYTKLLKAHAKLPDLILMDGGSIQLNAVKDVLINELNLTIPVAGMVKNDKHKTSDLLFGDLDDHIALNPQSQAFYLVQRIQDEVHRFAIAFHHQVHTAHSLSSKLDTISGVGPKTKNKLLRHFRTMNQISNASLSEIQNLGISKKVAQNVKDSLKIMKKD